MANESQARAPQSARTVLVTGAAHRVGAAIARRLAADGARVVIHFHGSEAAARDLAASLGGALCVRSDLARPEAPRQLLEACATSGAPPDAIVHAAASFLNKPLATTTSDEWDAVMALNLRAFFLLARELAAVRGDAGGQLVAIADSGARELWPGYLAHCVSKAALLDLVQALAKAMAPGFRVNAVVPGPVLPPDGTPPEEGARLAARTLLGRLGSPADVADAVAFLLGNEYATGAIVDVTGGAHLWRR